MCQKSKWHWKCGPVCSWGFAELERVSDVDVETFVICEKSCTGKVGGCAQNVFSPAHCGISSFPVQIVFSLTFFSLDCPLEQNTAHWSILPNSRRSKDWSLVTVVPRAEWRQSKVKKSSKEQRKEKQRKAKKSRAMQSREEVCVPRAECQLWGQIASPPLSLLLDLASKSFLHKIISNMPNVCQ